jgi:hypothetical protein
VSEPDPRGWYRLFDAFERTAQRLEVRDSYDRPDENAGFRRFLDGAAADPAYGEELRDWTDDVVRKAVSAGKTFARVRVVSDPPTDYQRFALRNAAWNTDAGEQFRYMPRAASELLHLPNYDYWVFDGQTLVLLHFADDSRFHGVHVVTAPDVVRQHSRWFDRAWQEATPYTEFIATRPDWTGPPCAS